MITHVAMIVQCRKAEDELRRLKAKFEKVTGVGQGDPKKMIKKQKN
jgi:hypothetical protein